MKNLHALSLFAILLCCMAFSLHAQQGFDRKKRTNSSPVTTALKTVKIHGGASTKHNSTPATTQNGRQLAMPQLGQPRIKITYARETGLPAFIHSSRKINAPGRIGLQRETKTATYDYLEELHVILKVEKVKESFAIRNIAIGNDNFTHVRMEQLYHGVPVYGADVVVHLDPSGEGESFNGRYFDIREKIDTKPSLSENDAVQHVTADLQKGFALYQLSDMEKKLVQYADPKATLCIYEDKGLVKTHVLAYHIVYCPSVHARWEYFVDATTGAVLHQFESTCAVDGPRTSAGVDLNGVSTTFQTYQVGANFFLIDATRPMYKAAGSVLPDEPIGGILTIDMNNTFGKDQKFQHVTSSNNSWGSVTQKMALTAHFNAGFAYAYYKDNHARESIDGAGGTIISIVNVTDEDGSKMDNAYWNGKAMFYGNGDTSFKPLAGGRDVAGHELTHGVVQSTANLEYQGESGAINESLADSFGSMMDPADWLLGEDVIKPAAFPSGAMRSMADPHNGGSGLGTRGYQPSHTSEAYTGTEDNGGVHINSGIPNHAFYLFAEAITRTKAAAVYYKALTDYLTKSSQFIDLRLAVIKAAGDLYGTGSNEVTQAGLAFDAVGITNGQGGDYTEELPGNPGTEFLLVYNTDPGDNNTLYRASLTGGNATALTTTVFNSRPSITDKGDVAVFVAADHTIHVIKTEPGSSATESVLQDETIWSNVVVSKGGSKLAAVTTDQEPKIYVYDFSTRQWGQFDLYNPTYSEGVNSAGPVYADALEWDYNGEFLVYDCFNRIDNTDGSPIEYWDVNFIHVWDGQAEEFADGKIEKLFSSLPEGVSIGNPSFAKNSPNIIAFDYVDETDGTYAILGCNIETNDVQTIVPDNTTLGYPSYNKTDERLAFTSENSGQFETYFVMLQSDKITAAANPVRLFEATKWPVYFATGEREIGDDVITDVPSEIHAEDALSCYPNPIQREVTVEVGDPSLTHGSVQVINSIGQRVYDFTMQPQDDQHFVLNLENLKSGYYIMHVSGIRKTGACKLFKK
ncbi:MAG TPA: M4 family metallopeptidase [Chryseolinea sp.]|nr:M4 family metallopeptidase [Chryseolinea sp.]